MGLMKDIAAYRKNKIQTKKAKRIFLKMFGTNTTIFSDQFLGVIESILTQYRNLELFSDTLSKESDYNA